MDTPESLRQDIAAKSKALHDHLRERDDAEGLAMLEELLRLKNEYLQFHDRELLINFDFIGG